MFILRPSPTDMLNGGLTSFPLQNKEFSELIASNIGAVIMPWMIYFQQSAVVARRLRTSEQLECERAHTMFGSFLTQLIMIGTLVTMAAISPGKSNNLNDVGDIALALAPTLGDSVSKVIVSLGFLGGSIC